MIQLLSTKYSKHIALILSVILLRGLVPAFGRSERPTYSILNRPLYNSAGYIPSMPVTIKKAPDTSRVTQHTSNNAVKKKGRTAVRIPSHANIGGPSQPEMSSFKSIGTDNLVNLFTGDFSYNIPLLDVGGYPVNLFYDGGISMEQEASWVGLGWNINPGTVSRNMRGVPDDFNGEDIMKQTQLMKPNKTWGVTLNGDLELVGI